MIAAGEEFRSVNGRLIFPFPFYFFGCFFRRADSFINKDAFLDYYRALICKENMDDADKLVYLERLHRNLPGFDAGTLELIVAYVEDKQWDKAVPLTLQYRKRKKANTEVLEALYLQYPVFKKKIDVFTD